MEEPDLDELEEKVITKIETLTKIVEYNVESCDESFKAFEYAQENISDKLNEFVKEFDSTKEENSSLKKDNARFKKNINGLTRKVESFDQKFEMMERESRKANLCIDGVLERDCVSLIKLVNDLFRDLEIDLRAEDVCHAIHQKGKMTEVGVGVTAKLAPL